MSFVGLYTGLSGIRASQTGIDTASHNIANANTDGYTRQRVELGTRPSYTSPVGEIGTGVDVQGINRLRDQFLDDRLRSAVAEGEEAQVRAEFLESLESLTGEPDEGVSVRLSRLWDAMETWSNDPDDAASRNQVLTEISAVAEGVRTTSADWDRLAADYAERRDTVVDEVNATLAGIDDLDRRIANADPDRIGPDLLDERDLLVDELAAKLGAEGRIEEDGSVTLSLGGVTLSGDDGPAQLEVDGEQVLVTVDGDDTDVTAQVSGELGGLQHALNEDLPTWREQLESFATGFAQALNQRNTEDEDGDPLPGGAELLGVADPDDPAGTLELLTDDPSDLVASTDGVDAPPLDASNAERFADLRTTEVDGWGDGDQRTIDDRFADLSIGLAGAVRSELVRADGAAKVATGAGLARDAEHGVSLDEEMVDLVRYQRSLESSARVMTTVDQALETLVNRTGIVGR